MHTAAKRVLMLTCAIAVLFAIIAFAWQSPVLVLRRQGFEIYDAGVNHKMTLVDALWSSQRPKLVAYRGSMCLPKDVVTHGTLISLIQLDNISVLDVDGMQYDPDAFAGISLPPSLKQAFFRNMRIDRALSTSLASANGVFEVALDNSDIDDDVLLDICTLPNLTHLRVSRPRLNPVQFRHLRLCDGLRKLVVVGTKQFDDEIATGLGDQNNLRALVFEDTGVGDDTLEWVSQSARNLQLLNVSGTHCTTKGLMRLGDLNELRDIQFWRNQVDLNDLRKISVGAGFARLERLAVAPLPKDGVAKFMIERNGRQVEFD